MPAQTAPPSTPTDLERLLSSPGPKRVLSLDGGGIRGVLALGFLGQMETLLRERYDDPSFVLADYFDLVGGTSTGAVIATALALGWPVTEIRDLYYELGRRAFRRRRRWLGPASILLGPRFDDEPVIRLLDEGLGKRDLGSTDLRTGLAIVTKRADTASVWALTNLPCHPFYEMNRRLLLRDVLRASTAAPTYFSPQWMKDVGGGEKAVFVDGAVSSHNNPSLLLFMVATLAGFGLSWPTGADRLLLCSIGTGRAPATARVDLMRRYGQLRWLDLLARQLIDDASELNETMLQWMSVSPTARPLDRLIGDLQGDGPGAGPLLTYLRWNVAFERAEMEALGFSFTDRELRALQDIAAADRIPDLDRIGKAAARAQVAPEHLAAGFDREG